MVIALPAVIVFGLATWLLFRSNQIGVLELVVVALFGFFLATTGLGHSLGGFLDSLFGLQHSLPSGPVKPPVNPPMPPHAVPTSGGGIPL